MRTQNSDAELGRRGLHMRARENIGVDISQTRPEEEAEEAEHGLRRGNVRRAPSLLRMILSSASAIGF